VADVPHQPCLGSRLDGFLHRRHTDRAAAVRVRDPLARPPPDHARQLHPAPAWTAQQLVEAFPEDTAPRWLLRDRDTIYNDDVRRRIASLGITEVVSSQRSPWQSPYVERAIGSIRRECLDHVIVFVKPI
jgi:transposase InsO family protein